MPEDDEKVEEWDGEGVPVIKENDKSQEQRGSKAPRASNRSPAIKPPARDPNTPNPEEGRLGSTYDRLRAIINEVSRTDKVEGIIRAFSKYQENDLQQLWNVLSLAGIGHRDKSFIIHNWATEIQTDIPDPLKKQINPNFQPSDKKEEKSGGELEGFYEYQHKQLEEELKMTEMEAKVAAKKNQIKMIAGGKYDEKNDRIDRLEKLVEDKLNNPNNLVPITERVPMMDNGKAVKDERGQIIYKEVTRMITPEQASKNPNEMNEMQKMMWMMKMFREMNGPKVDPEVRRLEDDKRWANFDLKFKDQQDFYEGEIGRLETKYDDREKELKHNKELEGLRDEIHETRKLQEQSDERFNVSANKDIIEKGQKEVKEGVDGLRTDVKDGMDRLVDEQIAQKQFDRKIQEMNMARAMGMTPTQYREYYEKSTVPEVDEQELARETGVELIEESSSVSQEPPPAPPQEIEVEKPQLTGDPFEQPDQIAIEPEEPSFMVIDPQNDDEEVTDL